VASSPKSYRVALGDVDAFEFETRTVVAHSSSGLPYKRAIWCGMPLIKPEHLLTTFYLYDSKNDALKGRRFGGTGFFLGVPSGVNSTKHHLFAVTNWHVAIKDKLRVIRINKKDGGIEIFETSSRDWRYRKGWHDVAIMPFRDLNDEVYDIGIIDAGMLVTDTHLKEQRIGVGDDVFMVGRFVDHDGGETNRPAARFGHISMMPEVPIEQPTGAKLPSFCLDMNSRTGFSGSPVFVYRTLGGELANIGKGHFAENQFLSCLGIHWGQFPEEWELTRDQTLRASARREALVPGDRFKGWSGMTCVSPGSAIIDLLNEDQFLKSHIAKGDEGLRMEYRRNGWPPSPE
jgi:hypothetical protein